MVFVAKKPPRSKANFVPKWVSSDDRLLVREYLVQEKKVATISLKESNADSIHIFFLHGGAYVMEALSTHWKLLVKILLQTNCRISILDYPLTPEHTFRETYAMVSATYDMLASQYVDDKFTVMGDSAGGGLAMGFTQQLIKIGHFKKPFQLVLLSPWLDLSLSNPKIHALEKRDIMLSKQMLNQCANSYSGGEEKRQFMLSPIYGTIKDLPRLLIIYSTHELFYADCEKLKERCADEGIQHFTFKTYPKLPHDWGILPIPERSIVINEVCDFIQNEI